MEEIELIHISQDNQILVSTSANNLQIWDQDCRYYDGEKAAFINPKHRICSINSTESYLILAVKSEIFFVDNVNGRFSLLKTCKEHSKGVTSLEVFNGGASLLSGSIDGTIIKWDLKPIVQLRKQQMAHCANNVYGVQCIKVTLDNRFAVTGGFDGTVRIWNIERFIQIQVHRMNSGLIVGIHLENNFAVTIGNDSVLLMIDFESINIPKKQVLREERQNYLNNDIVSAFCVVMKDTPIVLVAIIGKVEVWDLNSETKLITLQIKDPCINIYQTMRGREMINPCDNQDFLGDRLNQHDKQAPGREIINQMVIVRGHCIISTDEGHILAWELETYGLDRI